MPKISALIQNMPEYPFARVSKISKMVEQRDGIPVINARIGIPDQEAPRTIKECMTRFIAMQNSTFGYPCDVYPQRGIPEFIEAIIADYREKYGVKILPENIAVTGWTKEVLHNLVRLFSRGKILIPDPVYPAYEGATVLSHNSIKRVRTSRSTGWLPEFDFSDEEVVALYFCDPNNPTGAVADTAFYHKLVAEMKSRDICGIFDKAYKDYIFENDTRPVSITQVPGLLDYGFEVVSFSKHFNLVGVGLGWVISSQENIDLWLKFSGHYSQGVEWYKQKVGAEALTNPAIKAEMKQYFDLLKERRDIMVKGLNELGLKVHAPLATPYLWVEVPNGYDDETFVLEKMIGEAHVAFMPGSYFGECGKGYFRATLFISREDIEKALERISKVRSW